MSLIAKIFKFNSEKKEDPIIMFGRYSDSYKSDQKYASWDRALELFEQNKYHESYLQFFEYLKDDHIENVFFEEKGEIIEFELYQGSKKTIGSIADGKIWAEAKIALSKENAIGILRKLIELNFNLKYCRYALDREENITMVFNSYFLDCSPYKLYYALKEISTHADKQDDILIKEFEELEPVNTGHIREIDQSEKEIKYDFLIERTKAAIDKFENGKLDKVSYPGGKSFQLLDAVYKLDYLLKPEGVTMHLFEDIHKHFFKPNANSAHQKNNFIIKTLSTVSKTKKEDFNEEIYEVLSTFGVTSPTSFDQFKSFAQGELSNIDWYIENNYQEVALSIPSYIVGYSLFNYALPAPLSKLLHLFFRITEQEYFDKLGFQGAYIDNGTLNKSLIKKNIKEIKNNHKGLFPHFLPDSNKLNYESLCLFSKSFIQMTIGLNMKKKKKIES